MEVKLRRLSLSDIDDVLNVENDSQFWHLSGTKNEFTRDEIHNYVENDIKSDITDYGQIRFVIDVKGQFAGLIDLYEYDEKNKIAGVGIIVLEIFQNKGIGKRALNELIDYAKAKGLRQLFARIEMDNAPSIRLFNDQGFKEGKTLKGYVNKKNVSKDCKEYWINI